MYIPCGLLPLRLVSGEFPAKKAKSAVFPALHYQGQFWAENTTNFGLFYLFY